MLGIPTCLLSEEKKWPNMDIGKMVGECGMGPGSDGQVGGTEGSGLAPRTPSSEARTKRPRPEEGRGGTFRGRAPRSMGGRDNVGQN